MTELLAMSPSYFLLSHHTRREGDRQTHTHTAGGQWVNTISTAVISLGGADHVTQVLATTLCIVNTSIGGVMVYANVCMYVCMYVCLYFKAILAVTGLHQSCHIKHLGNGRPIGLST